MTEEKRYEIAIDLYKHFNQLIFTALGFIYTLTSGLVAFYFAHNDKEYSKYILIICICVSAISILLSILSVCLLHNLKEELEETARLLKLQRYPSIRPIRFFLYGNIIIFFVLAIFLIKLI